MSKRIIERKIIPLLGKSKKETITRLDKLVQWSTKHTKGDKYTKDFSHGLRLSFVADGDNPKIYLYWNQGKFCKFKKELSFTPEYLFFVEFGVCVSYKEGVTIVTLPGVGGTKVTLWDSRKDFCAQNEESTVNWLTGMVVLEEEGIFFYTQTETQQQLEEASALASIVVPSVVGNAHLSYNKNKQFSFQKKSA